MKDVKTELVTIKKLVTKVLEEYPDTRANDTLLYLKCCQLLGAKTIKQASKLDLSIISVHKIRQVIQNKEGLYKPSKEVLKIRNERRKQIKKFMIEVNI